MAGMRDKLIHDYFNVDTDLVICKTNIPGLLVEINKIISKEENIKDK